MICCENSAARGVFRAGSVGRTLSTAFLCHLVCQLVADLTKINKVEMDCGDKMLPSAVSVSGLTYIIELTL